MDSLPKVISVIEAEIDRLDTSLKKDGGDTAELLASEQAGLTKLLAFAREISGIQARFEKFKKKE